MLWSQRRNSGAHGAENSIQISALAGVGPWHLAAADIATRLPRTPFLVASYDMQEATAGQL